MNTSLHPSVGCGVKWELGCQQHGNHRLKLLCLEEDARDTTVAFLRSPNPLGNHNSINMAISGLHLYQSSIDSAYGSTGSEVHWHGVIDGLFILLPHFLVTVQLGFRLEATGSIRDLPRNERD